MERETKNITLPISKLVVTLKTYLTGREANQIKESTYKSMKIDMATGQPVVSELSGEFMIQQEVNLLDVVVTEIAGSKDSIRDRLLDLHDADYQTVVAEVNSVYKGNLAPAK